MGRGLSRLQTCILRVAYENRVAEKRNPASRGADVYSPEILVEYFGWRPRRGAARVKGEARRREVRRHPARNWFAQAGIEPRAYGDAHTSLSRAMLRLEQRGLIKRRRGALAGWRGGQLTPEGLAAAAALSGRRCFRGELAGG